MSHRETPILKDIQANLSRGDTRLWRNNRGEAWTGETQMLLDGSVLIRHPRRIDFGLCDGAGDLIGYHRMQIADQMVGSKLPVFLSIECKSPNGRMRITQRAFHSLIYDAGGFSGTARSVSEARGILDRYRS